MSIILIKLFLVIIPNNDRIMFRLNHNNRKVMLMVLIHQHSVLQEMSFKMNDSVMKFLLVLVQVIIINIRIIVLKKVQ
jgi:hypothetical protein